jgi:mannose-6-phosphate isomerase-like protein (cupin superfamily)
MKLSRRHFGLSLPFVSKGGSAALVALPSAVFRFEDLPVRKIRFPDFEAGSERHHASAWDVDLHESELAPGEMPHAPHQHLHEELLLIQDGQLEITINGKTTQLNRGSVAYVASRDHHGWRNSGTTTARYFVLALGAD